MAHTVFKNNAETTLAAAFSTTATSMTVADASLLPAPGTGQVAYLTVIRKLTGEKEVISYTGNDSSQTISGITRDVDPTPDLAGDGSPGLSFVAGDSVQARIPQIVLDQFVQRQGNNGQGDNDITGDLYWSDAAGPAILNEAATTTNPTIIPNQAEPDTGIGWESDTLHMILGGVTYANFSSTGLSMAGSGWIGSGTGTGTLYITGDANTSTGAGIILRGTTHAIEPDVGNLIVQDIDVMEWTTGSFYAANAAGPALMNEAATSTNPTIVPDRADVTTGVGGDGAGEAFMIAGGAEIAGFNASGMILGNSGARVTTILDEDTMSSDSATALATQQSIKAYVDTGLATKATPGFAIAMAISLGGA